MKTDVDTRDKVRYVKVLDKMISQAIFQPAYSCAGPNEQTLGLKYLPINCPMTKDKYSKMVISKVDAARQILEDSASTSR